MATFGDYSPLSNMFTSSLVWKEETFCCAEAAFCWEKVHMCGYEHLAKFVQLTDGTSAKILCCTIPVNKEWETSQSSILQAILMAKAAQCSEYFDLLLSSETFVYDSPDPIWGRGKNGAGENHLGKLHDIVRKSVVDVPRVTVLCDSILQEMPLPEDVNGKLNRITKQVTTDQQSTSYTSTYVAGMSFKTQVCVHRTSTIEQLQIHIEQNDQCIAKSNIVVVCMGLNNLLWGDSADCVTIKLLDFCSFLEKFTKPGTTVLLSTLLQTQANIPVQSVNKQLTRSAMNIIQLDKAVSKNHVAEETFYKDDLYLKDAGLRKVAFKMYNYVKFRVSSNQ